VTIKNLCEINKELIKKRNKENFEIINAMLIANTDYIKYLAKRYK
jgi:hypothetical protein